MNRRNNRRMADVEADTKEFELYKERIEELMKNNRILQDNDVERVQLIRSLNKTITELQSEIIEKEREIGQLRIKAQWLTFWHCSRSKKDCGRRLPPQIVEMEYNPPKDIKDEILHVAGIDPVADCRNAGN